MKLKVRYSYKSDVNNINVICAKDRVIFDSVFELHMMEQGLHIMHKKFRHEWDIMHKKFRHDLGL